MPSFVALLRGVNVGGNKKLSSSDLKAACESAGLQNVRTYLQSGNVVFRSRGAVSAKRIEDAIREQAGVETRVVLRSAAELKSIIDATPFHGEYNPSAILVTFLDRELSPEVRSMLEALVKSEELHFAKRELYVYYPAGIATSKLSNAMTEKKLGVVATARNWNTVNALLGMMEE
jgi:uncharacterized protein (DUF1697 family)